MVSRSTEDANEEIWNPERKAFAVRVGKVVRVNPKDHSVDVVLSEGGMVFKAQILETWGGTNYGDKWLPQFTPDPGVPSTGLPAESFRVAPQQKQDAYCLVAFAAGRLNNAYVLGFFYPEVSQMMVDGFQRLTRYAGDTFSAVSAEGDHYLAFDQTGGFFAFHGPDGGRPPDLTQRDYDRRLFTSRPQKSFTLMTANGDVLSLDVASGVARLVGTRDLELEGTQQADLYGAPVVVRGAEDLYLADPLGSYAGQCLAPFSGDETLTALNHCVNAAYSRRLTRREQAVNPLVSGHPETDGWRFLRDGDAGRLEIGPDGRLRHFQALGGTAGQPITWAYPQPDYQGHFVHLNFPTVGIQRFVVPPRQFTVTGIETVNATAWTSSIGTPSEASPVTLAAGTVVTVEVTAIDGLEGAQISIWGNRG